MFELTCSKLNDFSEKALVKWILRITSIHGSKATMPFLKSVEVQKKRKEIANDFSSILSIILFLRFGQPRFF